MEQQQQQQQKNHLYFTRSLTHSHSFLMASRQTRNFFCFYRIQKKKILVYSYTSNGKKENDESGSRIKTHT
jgi:hypothetical protein